MYAWNKKKKVNLSNKNKLISKGKRDKIYLKDHLKEHYEQ